MKKNNHQSEDAGVMQEFDRLRAILAGTHTEIPQLLARERTIAHELGLSETEELHKQLDDVGQQRQAAIRRRAASLDAMVAMEGQLQAGRAAVETQRQAYVAEAVAAFQERYKAAVSALQACWAEGRTLAATLRCEVKMPLPVTVAVSAVDGVARAVPILGESPSEKTVDAEAAKLGAQLDQLDEALSLCAAIRQIGHEDQRHRRLCMERRTSADMPSVYTVVKPVNFLGATFERGALVDSTVINVGTLSKFLIAHCVVQAADRPAAA